jgi:hypothetical protein
MTTSIVKIERTSGSIGRPSVAPGPSGGTYFAEGSNSTGIAHVARLDNTGTLVWAKEITISGSTTANGVTPNIYSSSDHLAVVLRYYETATSTYKTSVVLYQSDGTMVWEKLVPVRINRAPDLNGSTSNAGFGGLALAEDESVYLTGTLSSNTQLALVKLNGSDGSLAWVVDLYPSTGALSGDWPAEIEMLSGGDPVVTFYGYDIGGLGEEYTHVQRITASTGAAAWTRSVFWGFGSATGAAIGVDPSDNIYLSWPVNSGNNVGVVKLDSSGSTLWNREIPTASGSLVGAMRLSATSAGVYIHHNLATGGVQGHYFVAAAGTTGAGLVALSRYTPAGSAVYECHGSRALSSQALLVVSDASGTNRAGIVLSDLTGATDDGAYSSTYTRASSTLALNSASATIASPSYTRASAPSLTLATSSITETANGLTATLLTQAPAPSVCTATGKASGLAFGLPIMIGVQSPYTISTTFGTADARNRGLYATGKASGLAFGTTVGKVTYPATGKASGLVFGTAVYTANASKTATGIAATTAFGEPRSIRDVAPYPIGYATGDAAATAFGTPAIANIAHLTASGFSTTTFGAASSTYGLTASALAAATTFGTAKARLPLAATSLASTLFGTPVLRALGYPAGFTSTHVGSPTLRNKLNGTVTGFTATAFGTPTTRGQSRTRGAKFRTQFGTPQAERTAP